MRFFTRSTHSSLPFDLNVEAHTPTDSETHQTYVWKLSERYKFRDTRKIPVLRLSFVPSDKFEKNSVRKKTLDFTRALLYSINDFPVADRDLDEGETYRRSYRKVNASEVEQLLSERVMLKIPYRNPVDLYAMVQELNRLNISASQIPINKEKVERALNTYMSIPIYKKDYISVFFNLKMLYRENAAFEADAELRFS